VSYTNPPYLAAAYRMKGNLEDVKARLEAALGKQKEYGSEDGIKERACASKLHDGYGEVRQPRQARIGGVQDLRGGRERR